jgi:hypothetical protein
MTHAPAGRAAHPYACAASGAKPRRRAAAIFQYKGGAEEYEESMSYLLLGLVALGVVAATVFAFRRAGTLERAAEERERADKDDDWFERI